MLRCRGPSGNFVVGCVAALGCASAEKAPLVVVAAPAPVASATPTPAPPETSAESTRVDGPLWRSTAKPAAGEAAASDPSTASPGYGSRDELLADADRLMGGGELSRAQKNCAAEPPARQQACMDAVLERAMAGMQQEFDREFRGLELLQKAGERRCPGAPESEQHSECVLAEMERMVTELAPACASKSGQAQHRCIVDEVFRQLGP